MASKVKVKNHLIILGYFFFLFVIILICNKITTTNKDENEKAIRNFKVTKASLKTAYEEFKKHKKNNDLTKINFWHNLYTDERIILQEIIRKFEQEYPGIKVLEDNKGSWPQIFKNVTGALAVGKQPQLVVSYPDHVGFYHKSGKVLPLGQFIDNDDLNTNVFNDSFKYPFLDGYCEKIKFGNKEDSYYLPFLKTTEIMFYNNALLKEIHDQTSSVEFKQLVDSKGYIKKRNRSLTWGELEIICKEFEKYKTTDFVPILVDSETNLFIISSRQQGIIYPDQKDKTQEFLEDDKIKTILKTFNRLYNKKYLTLSKLIEENNIQKIIKDKNIAFYITSTRRIDSLCEIDGFIPSFTSIPTFGKEKNILQGSNVNLFYSKDPKENYASWFFLKYLTSFDVYQKFLEKNKLFNITRNYNDDDKTKLIKKIESIIDQSIYSDDLKKFRKDFFNKFILDNGKKIKERKLQQDFFVTSVFEKSDFFRNIITDLFIDVLIIKSEDENIDRKIDELLQIAITRIIK
ncbi:MAG: extracellular solute-binding protein [Phytoplasma sp.]|uniref:extracellular solute-binding protein n=1 Tax=Phytoplasma sp. TaxID=2155 RepID=UPI002B417836|nr:extracellular solute-binding protein [Phytoplasma sp.]WRH06863.1 MAG: extracellular solute-binding protein [Phytoplasma sp.]